MFFPKLNFSDAARNLVPGFIVVAGGWYLYRPFLLKTFPFIIEDVLAWNSQTKIIICFLLCLVIGIFYDSISDVAVAVLSEDFEEEDEWGLNTVILKIVKAYAFLFSFKLMKDPRIVAVNKYLNSNRRQHFTKLHNEWGLVHEEEIKSDIGKTLAHQHIVSRLRAHSEQSAELERALTNHLHFTCTVYLSVITLFGLSVTSFFVDIGNGFRYFGSMFIVLTIICFVYVASVAATGVLKKRISYYYIQIMTLALHFYIESENKVKISDDKSAIA